MVAFILNSYDAELNLTDKDDRKMYNDACKGLKEANLFDGKKENYTNFVKLIKKEFKTMRGMKTLDITKSWS